MCIFDYYEKILYQILGPILGVRLILECDLYSNKYGNHKLGLTCNCFKFYMIWLPQLNVLDVLRFDVILGMEYNVSQLAGLCISDSSLCDLDDP